jgi:peptidoglycan/LPS O-acetylase OafA/YrhL
MSTLNSELSLPQGAADRAATAVTQAYRPDIDGIRAVAVLAVVGFHAFPNFILGGFVGVDVFFVISGYLITNMLLASARSGGIDLRDFYRRRVRRILPALLVVLTACAIAAWLVLLSDEFKQLGRHLLGGTLFASKMGQLAGNHFLTIIEGREQLKEMGRVILWEGAQDILFERAE